MRHYNIIVTGKVQGVYFRAWAQETALNLGIKGYVMNRQDGSVYIEAEGDETNLKKLVDLCHSGPEKAIVEDVHYQEGEVVGYQDFEVRR